MPVLDTSFLIDLQRDRPHAIAALHQLEGDELIVPAQVAREFLAGFADPLPAFHRMKESYDVVLESEEHIVAAARLFRQARSKGHPCAWNDVAVAAEAFLQATFVVTADPRPFKALGVELWDYRRQAKRPAQ